MEAEGLPPPSAPTPSGAAQLYSPVGDAIGTPWARRVQEYLLLHVIPRHIQPYDSQSAKASPSAIARLSPKAYSLR